MQSNASAAKSIVLGILFLLPLAITNIAEANTLFSGAIIGDATWTPADSPYIVSYLQIPSGASLTILPGTIVKFEQRALVTVWGTLTTSGAGDPVVFTSLTDDSVGGDTNADGSTTAAYPGEWSGIIFYPSSTGNFHNTIIRYGGLHFYDRYLARMFNLGMIENDGGNVVLTDSHLEHAGVYGIEQMSGTSTLDRSEIDHTEFGIYPVGGLGGDGGTLSIHNSSIYDNVSYGIYTNTGGRIDATANYWGSSTGPTHPSNPAGVGDRVSDGVNFGEWLSGWRATTAPPACTTNCYSNVLFLPGVESSRLYEPLACDAGICEQKLWEPGNDAQALQLSSDTTGASVSPSVYTKPGDILDNAYVPVKGNIYASFMGNMDNLVSSGKINAWESVPYDWRLSPDQVLSSGKLISGNKISYLVATSSPYIIQELKRLAASSKSGKVTIIAHSNGGLITKRLTQILGADAPKLIDKIIFVAVPQVGTPKAAATILHGVDQALPFEFYSPALSEKAARALALNMPSAYNLLPSSAYFTNVMSPVVTIDPSSLPEWVSTYGTTITTQSALRKFLTDTSRAKPDYADLNSPEIGNVTLVDQATALHVGLDAWTPPQGIQLIQIAGWGDETLSGVTYKKVKTCQIVPPGRCGAYTNELTFTPNHVVDGDGTVVVPSALWTSTTTGAADYWVNLQKYNSKHPVDALGGLAPFKHADILEVNELRSFLLDTLTNSVQPLSAYTYVSTSSPLSTETRLNFTLHSPLTLEFYDVLGNHVGLSTSTGQIDLNVPGADYERYGDVQWLSLPQNIAGQLVMHGTGSGSFTLDAEEVSGNSIESTASFEGIPSSTSTTASMGIDPMQSVTKSGALVVDSNGDGKTDLTLHASEGSTVTPDITPPEAHISFSTSTQKLLIKGVDETSGTTVVSSVTSSTITDAAGNTTVLHFSQYKDKNRRALLTIDAIRYNGFGVPTATTTLKYKWNTDKKGAYTMFASYIKTATSTIETHWRPKKGGTIVMTKPTDCDDSDNDDDSDGRPTKQKLPGMVVQGLQTGQGSVTTNY